MPKAWAPSAEVQSWLRETYAYDPETGVISRRGTPVGAHREGNGYMRFRIACACLGVCTLASVHRVAWFFISGSWPAGNVDVDHVNMDRSDNRACNLRAATRSQNMANTKKMQVNNRGVAPSSRYKGVSWEPRRQLWRATVGHGDNRTEVGRYESEEAAARAYDAAAREAFGEFARVNFPTAA